MVQTGKRREHRAAVLVTTRRSTESQRSGRKRDFKFRKSRKEKNVHLKDEARQGHLLARRLLAVQRAVGATSVT